MKTTFEGEDLLVLDDFLGAQDFELVWNFTQAEAYERVHAHEWVNAWRVSDGEPLRGPVYLSHRTHLDTRNRAYPVGTGIDLLFRAILEMEDRLVKYVGRREVDWLYFFARSYLYPANTGLSWHRDNKNNVTGAFSFYAHPSWNAQWAGELLVADASTKHFEFPKKTLYGAEARFLGTAFDNSVENEKLMDVGIGQYVIPRPNRLVILTAGSMHAIRKVDPAAGNHLRCSLQGFFMFPEKKPAPEAP